MKLSDLETDFRSFPRAQRECRGAGQASLHGFADGSEPCTETQCGEVFSRTRAQTKRFSVLQKEKR